MHTCMDPAPSLEDSNFLNEHSKVPKEVPGPQNTTTVSICLLCWHFLDPRMFKFQKLHNSIIPAGKKRKKASLFFARENILKVLNKNYHCSYITCLQLFNASLWHSTRHRPSNCLYDDDNAFNNAFLLMPQVSSFLWKFLYPFHTFY